MILAKGKLYDNRHQEDILSHLEEEIAETRRTQSLSPETVIAAADRLRQRALDGDFHALLAPFLQTGMGPLIQKVLTAMSQESLTYRMQVELGGCPPPIVHTAPPMGQQGVEIRPVPLGTLLHIAAGNADGLPAYAAAEGLLTGNVNLIKLPQADSGLSVRLLWELTAMEPALADFLYVFDTPSEDVAAMKKLASIADGISVWGGEEAIRAVRTLAPPGAKLMEWGHRLGFVYISGWENKEEEMKQLAEHILSTRQLLCSSCQTIFLDTKKEESLTGFCREFLLFLEQAAQKYPFSSMGEAAEVTLRRLDGELESILSGSPLLFFSPSGCCLTICQDEELELSPMFGSCLVKALPRQRLFSALRRSHGVLQTAGLICQPSHREELTRLLASAGVSRITRAGTLSEGFCGEGRDGEFPLRRFLRYVTIE